MLRKLIGKLLRRKPATAGQQLHELAYAERARLARGETLRVRLALHQLREAWLAATDDVTRRRIELMEAQQHQRLREIDEYYFPEGRRAHPAPP